MTPQAAPATSLTGPPLYSEFGRKWGRTAYNASDACWWWFLVAAVVTTALSSLANSNTIHLLFTKGQKFPPGAGTPTIPLTFGYLSELNAAPAYLLVVPLLLLFAFAFLSNFDAGLESLAKSGRLRFAGSLTVPAKKPREGLPRFVKWLLGMNGSSRPASVLEAIEHYNRRAFPPLLLIAIPAVVFWFVVTTERNWWNGGDYETGAFGYVQAVHLSGYPNDVTLAEFESCTKRQVKPIKGIEHKSQWWVHTWPGGPSHPFEKAAFHSFLVAHFILQGCFITVGVWLLLKVIFVLWFTARALQHRGDVALDLNYGDKTQRFGCGVLDRCWPQLLLAVFLFFVLAEFSYVTNAAKGSMRQDLAAPLSALIGQGFVRWGPPALVVVLFIYFFYLYMHADRLIRDKLRGDPEGESVSDQRLFVTGKLVGTTFMSALSATLVRLLPPDSHSPLQDVWNNLYK